MYTGNTMKNITLSADEKLIEAARQQAAIRGTTLNADFREWLERKTVSGEELADNYDKMMKRLKYVNAGRKFTREEMNQH